MTTTLTKTTKLSRNELRDIKKLITLAAKEDKFTTKVYWNILQDRKIPEFDDYFYYINGNLVGYLGLFVFKAHAAEVCSVIHPKYRGQGIFKRLFEEAWRELERREIPIALLLCNKGAEPGETVCQKMGAEYSHAEIEMTAKKKVDFEGLPEITMRDVSESDVMELARMDSVCFNTNFEKMVFRFINGLTDKNRVVWMAVQGDKDVGKVHIRFDEDRRAYIHDLCVPPENRRKRIGIAMTIATMEKLRQQGYHNIYLDVEESNPNAVAMYEKCGFEETAVHNFWKYPQGVQEPEEERALR